MKHIRALTIVIEHESCEFKKLEKHTSIIGDVKYQPHLSVEAKDSVQEKHEKLQDKLFQKSKMISILKELLKEYANDVSN